MAYLDEDDPTEKYPQRTQLGTPGYATGDAAAAQGTPSLYSVVGNKDAASTANDPSHNNQSSFVNFDSYMNANGDAAKRTADQLASSVAGKGAAAQNTAEGLSAQFAQAAGNATPSPYAGQTIASDSANVGGRLQQKRQGLISSDAPQKTPMVVDPNGPQPTEAQALAGTGPAPTYIPAPGPASTSGMPTSLSDAQNAAGATYGGPNSLLGLSGYGAAASGVHDAQESANALGTTGGREALMARLFGQGAGGPLDAALTGAVGGQRLGAVGKQYGGLDDYFQKLVGQSAGQGAAARAATDASAAGWKGAIGAYDAGAPARAAEMKDGEQLDGLPSGDRNLIDADLQRNDSGHESTIDGKYGAGTYARLRRLAAKRRGM